MPAEMENNVNLTTCQKFFMEVIIADISKFVK